MNASGGLLRVLAVLVVALAAGLVGYQIGLSQDLVVEGGPAVAHPAYGPGFGFGWGFGGFLFFLLVLFLLFAAFRPRWGGPGPGWSGRGDWSNRVPPPFEDWHRRAHERGESRDANTA
jgi:hypothetical protein